MEFILINLTTLAYAYIDVSNGCSSLAQYTISRAVELLSGICHVKSLVLSKDTLEILSRAENLLMRLPTFHNLIHFSVDQGMYDFTGGALMDILEKSPNLEVLDIVDGFDPAFCLDGEAWTLSTVPHCLKSSLKLVSIWNFFGEVAEMQLLSFLLKHATKLSRIKMFCVECLSVDLNKQADISNQLQVMRKGLASCAIEFR
ncbi:putative F-box/LRR-repeat protein At5g15620 [Prosopis cineraria]|uniref:putative F-box/LRR-repeat protein At5g15620 n=1 Tax=Prosopis cineraria TaxID=364024 RepID=UPI00240F9866|nr:putative F-box/LRR-repeat protein At5g15620 [Prosopis cineraria]